MQKHNIAVVSYTVLDDVVTTSQANRVSEALYSLGLYMSILTLRTSVNR
jgi:hypothetical protein